MPTKKCPVCGVSVKLENLDRHVRHQHPRANVNPEEILTPDEDRSLRAAKTAARPAMTTRGKRTITIVAIAVAVALVLVVVFPRGTGPQKGLAAPDFTLGASTGGSVTLSSYRGSVVLLEFMDVDCSFCQAEAQDVLRYVFENYSSRARFLSVDVDFVGATDTMDRINVFRTTYGVAWTYVLDSSHSVGPMYGITGTPTTFILDRNGVITEIFRGRAPNGDASYAAALDQALQV